MTDPEYDQPYDLFTDIKALSFGIANLFVAGVDPESLAIDLAISDFIEAHIIEHPEVNDEDAEDDVDEEPLGYVIRDRWDNREIDPFTGTLYKSEEEAKASIDQAYARPDYNEFNILPVYL